MDRSKETQTQSLAELQQELKSLKALLLSRGPAVASNPSSPVPAIGRPSIPAWQLAGSTENVSPTPLPSTGSAVFGSIPISNGKGKEVDRAPGTP